MAPPNTIKEDIENIINNGIKGDIEFVYSNGRIRATLVLIYAGIDAMATLNMANNQEEVRRKDFIDWVDKYLHIPGDIQLTGVDFYGARCALLHSYGVQSRLSSQGVAREIDYWDSPLLPAITITPRAKPLLFVNISALKKAFFDGIDTFLVSALSDETKGELIQARMKKFLLVLTNQ